jgi:hypothetical protein
MGYWHGLSTPAWHTMAHGCAAHTLKGRSCQSARRRIPNPSPDLSPCPTTMRAAHAADQRQTRSIAHTTCQKSCAAHNEISELRNCNFTSHFTTVRFHILQQQRYLCHESKTRASVVTSSYHLPSANRIPAHVRYSILCFPSTPWYHNCARGAVVGAAWCRVFRFARVLQIMSQEDRVLAWLEWYSPGLPPGHAAAYVRWQAIITRSPCSAAT